jgi:hypothetical protein
MDDDQKEILRKTFPEARGLVVSMITAALAAQVDGDEDLFGEVLAELGNARRVREGNGTGSADDPNLDARQCRYGDGRGSRAGSPGVLGGSSSEVDSFRNGEGRRLNRPHARALDLPSDKRDGHLLARLALSEIMPNLVGYGLCRRRERRAKHVFGWQTMGSASPATAPNRSPGPDGFAPHAIAGGTRWTALSPGS